MRQSPATAKRAVIYMSVATAKQSSREQLNRQLELCKATAQQLSAEVVGEYFDVGRRSGLSRPGLQRMLGDIAGDHPNFVIVQDFPRLSEKLNDLHSLQLKLRRAGVKIVTSQPSAVDDFTVTLIDFLNESDRLGRSVKAKAAWAKRRAAAQQQDLNGRSA